MFDSIIQMISHNQIAQAVIVTAPAAAVGYSIRNLPKAAVKKIRQYSTYSIRVNSTDIAFTEVMDYVTAKVIVGRFIRSFTINSDVSEEWYAGKKNTKVKNRSLFAGYGSHYGVYRKHLVIVSRSLSQGQNGVEDFKEQVTVRFFARSNQIIDTFFADVREYIEEKNKTYNGIRVLSVKSNGVVAKQKIAHRPLNSIFLPDNIPERVVQHVKDFENNEAWYNQKGIPYHTGILFSGIPGTSKTSLIRAVASATGRDLFIFSLGNMANDRDVMDFSSKFVSKARSSILVIEDFDATGGDVAKREEEDVTSAKTARPRASMSSILNMLDGLYTPDGMVVIATTNHVDRIDPAMIRPGRFDLHLSIGNIGKPEFDRMVTFFEMNPEDYTLEYFHPMTGATLRTLLLSGGIVAVEEYQKNRNTHRFVADA